MSLHNSFDTEDNPFSNMFSSGAVNPPLEQLQSNSNGNNELTYDYGNENEVEGHDDLKPQSPTDRSPSNFSSTTSSPTSSNINYEPYENLSKSMAITQPLQYLDGEKVTIKIVDTGRYTDPYGKKNAIGYVIQYNDKEVVRRYSEFDNLNKILIKLYPTIIIPPIPSKHSILKYFLSPIHAQNDPKIINTRKRRFQSFLNNCYRVQEIRKCIIFQKFLNPEYIWKDVLSSPPVTILPLNNLLAPPLNPTKPSPLHLLLPAPNANTKIESNLTIDRNGEDSEDTLIHKYDNQLYQVELRLSNYLSKFQPMSNKIKQNKFHLHSLSSNLAELGAYYNSLSIDYTKLKQLSMGIERIGHSFDVNYVSLEILIENINNLIEEQIDEIIGFLTDSKRVIIFKNLKILQYRIIATTIKKRSGRIKELRNFEEKLHKLDESFHESESQGDNDANLHHTQNRDILSHINERQVQLQLQKKRKKLKRPTTNLEPEFLTKIERTNEIERLTKEVDKLNECFKLVKKDISEVIASTLSSLELLDEFIEKKLKLMLNNLTQAILNWITESLKAWKEAKIQIDKI
ncbi:hypothetical protein KAFR_0C05420 [Kazachstania africana CBS 2517]|uniref:PX domain-containing protein n=1 Tax=Kazachstania africana (strain ATCC 22294 / BCRC 22015 / CBS 2517 / CECT 1963 / NBRC 1671 / NRRL Y-8276) TaxID=1071382 RepID=H2AT33_KAZAF|nr:hypothetical protein KAFR_0C05420 [Kazachstania africana CBS 2517]CCF57533.1 hypothetical protein KAFR_0C05420 [Kazachstania africana CBS 2517]